MRAETEAALRQCHEELKTVTNKIHACRIQLDQHGYRSKAGQHLEFALGACDRAIRNVGMALGESVG